MKIVTSKDEQGRPLVSYAEQPRLFVRVVLASRCAITGRNVYTLHVSYPRIVHSEMMTHRVFNRNVRSSRAVPVMVLLEDIRNDPFIPWRKTGHQKGMQGVANWTAKIRLKGTAALFADPDLEYDFDSCWLFARDFAADMAESMWNARYAKQMINRLVEPWMWVDVLITATQWANFLHLRNHPAAEPHIRDLAVLVDEALRLAEPQLLDPGDWHMPYINWVDWEEAKLRFAHTGEQLEFLKKISAARCARISYTPFNGDPSYEREIERYNSLVNTDAVHASPIEHQCTPDTMSKYETYLASDSDENLGLPGELVVSGMAYDNPSLHGSLYGFIQARKLVPGECVHDE